MEVTVLAGMSRNALEFRYRRSALRLALLVALAAFTLLPLRARAEVPTSVPGCTGGQIDCRSLTRPRVAAQHDDWQDANDPRRMLARIQSNLDRVSAGQPTWSAPAGEASDPLLKIIGAYVNFLRGNIKGMDAELVIVEDSAKMVREGNTVDGNPIASTQKNQIASDESYLAATHNSLPLVRLYAGIRAVDGALFGSYGSPLEGVREYVSIHTATVSPLYGTSLRLPCRTVIGRVSQFVAAAPTLKTLGGPVLDCPVDGADDYAKDEMLATHPEDLRPHIRPTPPTHQPATVVSLPKSPPPGSHAAAIEEMASHPQQAAPILKRNSIVDARGELDYMLFLYAFEPETPARDATIRSLQANLQKSAMGSPGAVHDFPPTPYNGTDASLLNVIRLASETGIVGVGYAIPCPILTARPALLAATNPYYFSNRDNFMPRSGCVGAPSNFPADAVNAFETASTAADGNFIAMFQGSMVYGFESVQNNTNDKMKLDPGFFLKMSPLKFGYPPASFEYPYQVWGYTSLNNYIVSLRLKKLYLDAHTQLASYYREQLKLSRADSAKAARIALFYATFGSNCGNDVPAVSIRRSLLERAPLDEIKRLLLDGAASAPAIDVCAKYAGEDPLLLVAVGDPSAFPLVLAHRTDVNVSNPIGKTPLMEAAQFNQLNIVRLLLAHHARVNYTTWGDSDPSNGLDSQLGDDARTALMYAAANGSLKLIKTLLDAGADPFQADTKSYRAIDYLLGYGPTPPNPHLSKRERMQAAQWLF